MSGENVGVVGGEESVGGGGVAGRWLGGGIVSDISGRGGFGVWGAVAVERRGC